MAEKILPCPVCGRSPDVDRCGPAPKSMDLGWHAGCYGLQPYEHYVGVNRDTRSLVIAAWNAVAAQAVPKLSIGGP
jgi:hypothetical protein